MMTVTRATSRILFSTQNSRYRFMWVPGARMGWLFCESGTFAGEAFHVVAEDVRDLAWPNERVQVTDADGRIVLTTTPVVSVDRSES